MATRRQARKTAKAFGPGHKVKTARRLSTSQRARTVTYIPKTKKGGGVKTTAGGKVPYFAVVAPKKTRKGKSTPSL